MPASCLYRLRNNLSREELAICLMAGVKIGETLWLEGQRNAGAILGGLGRFQQTYQHALGTSPHGKTFDNMPMRYFENIGLSTE